MAVKGFCFIFFRVIFCINPVAVSGCEKVEVRLKNKEEDLMIKGKRKNPKKKVKKE